MEFITAIGLFETIFLIFLLAGKKNKTTSDYYLGLIFLLYSFYLGGIMLSNYNARNQYPFPAVINTYWLFLFLHGPALWLYIKSLTERKFTLKYFHFAHLVPFMVFLSIQYIEFIRLPVEEKISFMENELYTKNTFFRLSLLGIGLSTIGYNIWAIFKIRKHRLKVLNEFSQTVNLELNWINALAWAALAIYSLNVLLFNLNAILQFTEFREISQVTTLFVCIYVLFLGYYGLQQGQVFTGLPDVKKPGEGKNEDFRTDKEPAEVKEFIHRLKHHMDHRQPYLDPELSLSDLSSQLKVRPEYLSEILNAHLGQNFADFINHYRIEEFKIQVLNPDKKHLSIVGMACECGFNSKASFYRSFTKFEATSPTAYLKRVSK